LKTAKQTGQWHFAVASRQKSQLRGKDFEAQKRRGRGEESTAATPNGWSRRNRKGKKAKSFAKRAGEYKRGNLRQGNENHKKKNVTNIEGAFTTERKGGV